MNCRHEGPISIRMTTKPVRSESGMAERGLNGIDQISNRLDLCLDRHVVRLAQRSASPAPLRDFRHRHAAGAWGARRC